MPSTVDRGQTWTPTIRLGGLGFENQISSKPQTNQVSFFFDRAGSSGTFVVSSSICGSTEAASRSPDACHYTRLQAASDQPTNRDDWQHQKISIEPSKSARHPII